MEPHQRAIHAGAKTGFSTVQERRLSGMDATGRSSESYRRHFCHGPFSKHQGHELDKPPDFPGWTQVGDPRRVKAVIFVMGPFQSTRGTSWTNHQTSGWTQVGDPRRVKAVILVTGPFQSTRGTSWTNHQTFRDGHKWEILGELPPSFLSRGLFKAPGARAGQTTRLSGMDTSGRSSESYRRHFGHGAFSKHQGHELDKPPPPKFQQLPPEDEAIHIFAHGS